MEILTHKSPCPWNNVSYETGMAMWTFYTETMYTKMCSETMVEPSFRMSRLERDPFPPMWTSTRYEVRITGRGLARPLHWGRTHWGHLSLIQITWIKCATAQIQPPDWTKCKWLYWYNVIWNDVSYDIISYKMWMCSLHHWHITGWRGHL